MFPGEIIDQVLFVNSYFPLITVLMNPERWKQIDQLFQAALEREPNQRIAFLKQACMGDEALRQEVESMLVSYEQARSFIEKPALQAAPHLMGHQKTTSLIGRTIGPYKITGTLGMGGMGEVYLAEDSRLGRQVALKLLPAYLTQDPERVRRFKQEARAASALNHPNVATIYEIGEAEGTSYIAMEHVEGQTLDVKMRGQPLEATEIGDLGIQIADALDGAHAKEITHRDIKPANIMVTARGQVKVLDFGLAKMTRPGEEPVASSISTLVRTEPGRVLGTIQYMSPEQALGRQVDHRTDLFSLGVVLYEMATGRRPFTGTTASETMDRIIHAQPDAIARFNYSVPAELERIIRKCLEKDPERRYQSARELVVDLKNLKRESEPGAAAYEGVAPQRQRHLRRFIFAALALAVIVVIAFTVWKTQTGRGPTGATGALRTVQITTWPGLDIYPALSPDGNSIAYSSDHGGSFEIYVKPLTPGAREIQLTSDGDQNFEPAWSPDGKLIAYYSKNRGGIWRVPASGGVAYQLTEFGSRPAWSPDGALIAFQSYPLTDLDAISVGVTPPSTLWVVSSQSGEPTPITQVGNPPGGHGAPAWSPDGKRIAFVAYDGAKAGIWSASARGGDLRRMGPDSKWVYDPIYSPDGKNIYYGAVSELGNFVLFKLRLIPTSDEPVEIADTGSVRIKHLTISADGRKIAYSAPTMAGNLWSVPISPSSGGATGAPAPLTQEASYRKGLPLFSPDGKRIAYVEFRGGSNEDIWVVDADGKNPTQLSTNPANNWAPSWFPEGDRLAFQSNRQGKDGIWSIAPKSGREKLLVDPGQAIGFPRLSPDGKQIAFNSSKSGTLNIWTVPTEGGPPKQLTFDKESMGFPSWSPDGKFIALNLKRGEDTHVAIIPSSGGTPTQLTHDRGQSWPHSWSPEGDKIAFAGFRDGFWNVWWVSRNGGTQKRITNFSKLNEYVRYPAWSPLGNQIVFEYAETKSNIWTMMLK
jgi:eukaryotic-like serine/threonine-protein kinase